MSMDKTFVRARAEAALSHLDEEDRQFVEAYIKDRARLKDVGMTLLGWVIVGLFVALATFAAVKTPGCVEMNSGLRDLQRENAKLRAACIDHVLTPRTP